MTDVKGLTGHTLAEFTGLVAARGPVPGSGCAAAAIGALGAALASMALRAGRNEDPAEVVVLERLRGRLLAAVEADARAYGAWRAARAGGGGGEAELREAIAVPHGIAVDAAAALEQLHGATSAIRPALRAETLLAAEALHAAVRGASFTALENRPGDPLRAELEALRRRARGLLDELEIRLGARATTP